MIDNSGQVVPLETILLLPAAVVAFFAFLCGLVVSVDIHATTLSLFCLIGGIIGLSLTLKKLYDRKCL